MRCVIQRVNSASVSVDGVLISAIDRGYCLLVGLSNDDSKADVDYIVKNISKAKLFDSEDGVSWKRNLSEIKGSILSISQFTLYGRLNKGKKPDFSHAMKTDAARDMYADFLATLRAAVKGCEVKDGVFGAHMVVDIVNDGPVTILLDSREESSSVRSTSSSLPPPSEENSGEKTDI